MNKQFMKEKQITSTPTIQIRKDAGGNILHLQVFAEIEGNRAYGWAEKFTVPSVVTDDLREYEGKLFPSFASDSDIYIRGIASINTYKDGTQLHLNIKWGNELNFNSKEYGYILDLPTSRFQDMIDYFAQVELSNEWLNETRWIGEEE